MTVYPKLFENDMDDKQLNFVRAKFCRSGYVRQT